MFIYSALLTPSKWWSFSSFSATKHEMSFAQTSFWRVFWSLGYDEEKAVLEQWVASSSALLLREATKNAHEKIILHVSLAIRRLWTPAFLCSLSFKKWPGKSSNIFSPTFFGAKRQKSPMPFKAKKRLFLATLLSSLPIWNSLNGGTHYFFISVIVLFWPRRKRNRGGGSRGQKQTALFQRMELNEPIKRTKMWWLL